MLVPMTPFCCNFIYIYFFYFKPTLTDMGIFRSISIPIGTMINYDTIICFIYGNPPGYSQGSGMTQIFRSFFSLSLCSLLFTHFVDIQEADFFMSTHILTQLEGICDYQPITPFRYLSRLLSSSIYLDPCLERN